MPIQDAAWRVRYVAAKNFTEIQGVLGVELTREHLLPIFVDLLSDSEAEVRCATSMCHGCVH